MGARHVHGSPIPGAVMRGSKGAPVGGAPESEPLRPPAPSPWGVEGALEEKRLLIGKEACISPPCKATGRVICVTGL